MRDVMAAIEFFYSNNVMPYFARQRGQTLFVEGTGIGIDEQTYVDFYTLKKNWMKDGLIPPIDVAASIKSPDQTMLATHNSAVAIIPSNQLPIVSTAAGKELKLIPLPGPNTEKAAHLSPGAHFVISANSQNKEEAAKFINYLINDVDANKVLNAERGMPVASKVREGIKDGLTPEMQQAASYSDYLSQASTPANPPAPTGATENLYYIWSTDALSSVLYFLFIINNDSFCKPLETSQKL